MTVRLVFLAALVAGATALGRLATGSRRRDLAAFAWDFPAGLAILAAALLAVGLVPGGFRRASLLVVATTILAAAWIVDRRRAASGVGAPDGFPAGPSGTWIVSMLGAAGLIGFSWDRVPAVFHDTLAYHFAQPNLWLATGRIAPEGWSLHSWFPPGMSVLYGLGLAVGGDAAANDVNLLFGLTLAAMAADLSRRLWDAPTGAIAAGAVLTLPITIHAVGIPAADLGHGVFVLGAVGGGLIASEDPHPVASERWHRSASILAAGAVLTKYLGFLIPLAAGAVVLLAVDRGRPRRALRFVLPSVAAIAAWLVANAVVTGNPVAPVGAGFLPVDGLAPGGAAAFVEDARGGLPTPDDAARLLPRLVAGSPEDDRLYPTPSWGWAPPLLLAGAILVGGDRRRLRVLALAGVLFAVWFVSFRWERFLVADSALVAIACAATAVAAWRRGGPTRLVPLAAALLAGLAAVRAGQSVASFTGGVGVWLGRESPDAFARRGLPLMDVFAQADATLDRSRDRVLLVGDERHHRLDIPHAAPTGFNLHPLAERFARGDTPATAWGALRRMGFTHAIVDPRRTERAAARYPSLRPLLDVPGGWPSIWAPLDSPEAVAAGRPFLAVVPGESR